MGSLSRDLIHWGQSIVPDFVRRIRQSTTLNYIQADIFDSPPSHDNLGESDNLMDVQHRNAQSLNSEEESKRIKLPIHILTIHKMARISSDIVSEP